MKNGHTYKENHFDLVHGFLSLRSLTGLIFAIQIKALRNVVKMPEDNFNKPVSVTHQKMSWDFWYFMRKRPLAFKLCRMRNQYWIRTFFNANIFARDSLQQLRKISSTSYIVEWPQHIPRLISCIRQLELGLVFKVLDTLKTEMS